MSDHSEKPQELIPVTEFMEIVKFFDEGAKSKAGVSIWTKDNDLIANCNMISLSQSEKSVYTSSPILNNFPAFCMALQMAGDKCFLNMRLERATVFFNAKLTSYSVTNLQFTFPEKIFKIQRRLQQRFKILPGYVLRVTFLLPDNLLLEVGQKIYDISPGGLSFLVDITDPPQYQAGQVLKNLSFSIRAHEFHFAGEIIHCKPITETIKGQIFNKIKVGVKFIDISPDQTTIITDYVFEENRKYFARFM